MTSYISLRKIINELKANAASIPCDLGGGEYGHLGLVITVEVYVNMTPTAYICPLHLGILNITVGTPSYKAARLIE